MLLLTMQHHHDLRVMNHLLVAKNQQIALLSIWPFSSEKVNSFPVRFDSAPLYQAEFHHLQYDPTSVGFFDKSIHTVFGIETLSRQSSMSVSVTLYNETAPHQSSSSSLDESNNCISQNKPAQRPITALVLPESLPGIQLVPSLGCDIHYSHRRVWA